MADASEQSSGIAARAAAPTTRPDRRRIERIFGSPLSSDEAAMWSLMDEGRRASAIQRAGALARWDGGRSGTPAATAAADAGVTLVRFYQLAALWRASRSLASLGVSAAPPRRRGSQFGPEVNAVLQAAVVAVADRLGTDGSVRALALELAEEARRRGVADGVLPSHNTLRAVVERELRARRRRGEVGDALLLDHSSCGLARPDGSPWTLFAIVDAASQLVLGAAPGDARSATTGYRDAARDALARLVSPSFADVAWSDRLSSAQVVPGGDGSQALAAAAAAASRAGVSLNFTADRRAGRYLEERLGRTIGALQIWPAREDHSALPSWADARAPRLGLAKARARVALAVGEHDAALLAQLPGPHGDRAAAPAAGLLDWLAAVAD